MDSQELFEPVTPLPFQDRAIARALTDSAIWWFGTGGGKTIMASEVYARQWADQGPLLWITKKRELVGQARSIANQTGVVMIPLVKPKRYTPLFIESKTQHMGLVVHYAQLPTLVQSSWFRKIVWAMIVADECHYLKNRLSRRAKSLRKIRGKHRIAMTGTLTHKQFETSTGRMIPHPGEMWSVLDWVYPNQLPAYSKWYDRFIQTHKVKANNGRPFPVEMGLRDEAKYCKIFDRAVHTEDISEFLPLMTPRYVPIHLGAKAQTQYDDVVRAMGEDILVEVEGLPPMVITNKLAEYLKLYRLSSDPGYVGSVFESPKREWLRDFVKEGEGQNKGIVVATLFKSTAESIAAEFGWPLLTGDYDTRPEGQYPYLVGTIASLAGSIDLWWMTDIVFYELHRSTISMTQTRGRIQRIRNDGRSKLCHYLVVEGTVETAYWRGFQNNSSDKQLLRELVLNARSSM